MDAFILVCKEDEERQAGIPSKEASSPVLETMASFTDGAILKVICTTDTEYLLTKVIIRNQEYTKVTAHLV